MRNTDFKGALACMSDGGVPEPEGAFTPRQQSAGGVQPWSVGPTYPVSIVGRGMPGGEVGYQAVDLHDPRGIDPKHWGPYKRRAHEAAIDAEHMFKMLMSRGRRMRGGGPMNQNPSRGQNRYARGGLAEGGPLSGYARANMSFGRARPTNDVMGDREALERMGFEGASRYVNSRDEGHSRTVDEFTKEGLPWAALQIAAMLATPHAAMAARALPFVRSIGPLAKEAEYLHRAGQAGWMPVSKAGRSAMQMAEAASPSGLRGALGAMGVDMGTSAVAEAAIPMPDIYQE